METAKENTLSNEIASFSNVQETARLQQQVEHKLTKWQALKAYPITGAYMLGILWVMVLVGFENQAGGMVVSIPQFRKDFGYEYDGDYVLDGQWQSAINGGPIGTIVLGGFLGSQMADWIGRKPTLLIASLSTIGFITIEYLSTTIEVFFAGKFLNALSLGMISSVATTYMGEITPLALRGLSTAALNLSLSVGPFVCYLIANETSSRTDRMAYRGIFLSQWGFSSTAFIFLLFMPESPYYHVLKNKDEKALKQLRRLYKDEVTSQQQLSMIRTTIEESKELVKSSSYFDCFKGVNLRRTLVSISPFIMQPLSGVAFISGYSTYYYQLAGFSTHQSYQISCGAQGLSIAGCIASWFILDRFGRRAVILYGMISLSVLNLITAAGGVGNSKSVFTMVSAFIAMYNFFYNSSIGPVSYVIAVEHPTSRLRSKTVALGLASNYGLQCMWQFVLPYMFNPDQANMGSKINFIFFACSIIGGIVFYFWLPETANRSYEEIDQMYGEKLPAKKFKGHVCHFEEAMLTDNDLNKKEVTHVENV